ncbi:MAG: NAD-dependent epimerase/dehydratase family protein, partial [Hamadaea sp.]|nr:NAD-dependent epimerase/dehydratase family protein [Hamadaea sp.]
MRILIVGGTRFVGRHITEAVLAAGHDVTVLHRGTTGADLFPQATHLLADRNEDLGALRGMRWDATIDVSAYRPRQVDALADVLDGGAGHYVYVSTVSVYATPARPQYGEDSPLLRLPDGPIPDEVTLETYGPLKALCEERAAARFGPGILIVRPTYVVGPGDHTGRFTYWARRLARGGTVLAPGHADRPIQVIDARDQADFVVGALAGGLSGTFNTVCRSMPFGQLLDRIAAAVAPAGTTLTWVDPDFL